MFGWFKKRKRNQFAKMPTPSDWIATLETHMPVFQKFSKEDREELLTHTKILFHEKEFIGAHDLEVTEPMIVFICAQASMLLLHREPSYFPNVNTVIIYETAFASTINQGIGGGIYLKKYQARVGESNHKTKVVVLAWDSVVYGAENPTDGKNVVLHEFAHQLDSETGNVNGAPVLSSNSSYRMWGCEMLKEYEHLKSDIAHHHKTFIDKYGATNHAEFFAVITEAFFEKPLGMQRKHPQMYKLLSEFYKQNPADYL